MPTEYLAPIVNRLSHKRQERLWQLLAVMAAGWFFFSAYYFLTRRFPSATVCGAEAVAGLSIAILAYKNIYSGAKLLNVGLFIGMIGIVAESLISGQGQSDTLFFLCCASSIAAYQLGTRSALIWTTLSLVAILVTHFAFPDIAMLRTATSLDRLLIQLALPVLVFGLSFHAEKSSTRFAETLFTEKTIAEELAAVTTELQERTRLLSLAEQAAHVGHWQWNPHNQTLTLSPEARRICGLGNDPILDLDDFLGCLDDLGGTQLHTQLQLSSQCRNEFEVQATVRRPGDQLRYVSCRGFSEESASEEISAVFGILKDETETTVAQQQLRQKANELNELAKFDPLTGLANRHSFQLSLEEAVGHSQESGAQIALLLIDLDGFKEINDTMGHPCGDLVLQTIAERLQAACRGIGTVSRLGGDEFTIILHQVGTVLDIQRTATRIRNSVRAPMNVDGKRVSTNASIGVALCPQHTKRIDEFLSFADTAMYVAKSDGTGVEIYDLAMTTQLLHRRELENDLLTAWIEKQFFLEFQPLIKSNGQAFGAEALLRWQKGGRTVPPMEFIPHLEQSGAISKIGNWVLSEACHNAKRWHDLGLETAISVNISPVQFCDSEFVYNVQRALQESKLAGKYLDLELTESVLIQDLQTTANIINRLKSLGVTISIDDFGTGYSSLAYLRHLPLDRLKIDRTFVKDIPNGDDGTIAESIIVLARSLEMEVLAEGIETEEQLDFLKNAGCDYFQGYYFSRPLPPEQCQALLLQTTPSPKKSTTV